MVAWSGTGSGGTSNERAGSVLACRGPLSLALHGAILARTPRAGHRTMVRGIGRAGTSVLDGAVAHRASLTTQTAAPVRNAA